jgi:hypothetical protein
MKGHLAGPCLSVHKKAWQEDADLDALANNITVVIFKVKYYQMNIDQF